MTELYTPAISVVMPVYNADLYIKEAIESILNQTFTDFEFLIYNDGSTDKTHAIITSFNDERIVYKKIEKNAGYLLLLNEGLEVAKGKYIARMDADDIAMHNRFDEQYNYLEMHHDVGICGCWSEFIGQSQGIGKTPVSSDEVIYNMFFGSPMAHPTIMMRADLMRKFHLKYDSEFYLSEDYKLFSEAFCYFKLVNLPQVLLKYRIHNSQVSTTKWRVQFIHKCKIQTSLLCKCLKNNSENDYNWLFKFISESSIPDEHWLKEIENYQRRILRENGLNHVYPENILRKAVVELFKSKTENNFYKYYFNKYYNQKKYSPKLLVSFFKEKYKPGKILGKKLTAYFVLKCLIGYRKKAILAQ